MRTACDDFMDALLAGPLPDEQKAHAVVCGACRDLIGEHGIHGGEGPASPIRMGAVFREELKTEALREISAKPFALRWTFEAGGFVLLQLLVFGLAVAFMGADNWRLEGAPPWRKGLAAVLLLLFMGMGGMAALMPLAQRLRRRMLAVVVLAPLFVLLGSDGQRVCATFAQAVPCAVVEVLLALPLLCAAVLLTSRAAFQPMRTLLAAAAGGAAGLLALHLHCIDGSLGHLMGFHVLPWAVVALVAVAIRARLPSRSFVP